MKLKAITVIALISLIVFINSCENKVGPVPSSSTNCDTTRLTYSSDSNTMQPVINTYCAISGCHVPGGAAGAPDYTTYAGLQAYATNGQRSQFWIYLFVNKTMPLSPQPPLSTCNQNKFKAWLSAGAPQ